MNAPYVTHAISSVPIIPLTVATYTHWLSEQTPVTRNWLTCSGFEARSGQSCMMPDSNGQLMGIVLGLQNAMDFWVFGSLSLTAPPLVYRINDVHELMTTEILHHAQMAWGLGAYHFSRYCTQPNRFPAQLLIDPDRLTSLTQLISGVYWVRDLINTSAADLGPIQLTQTALDLALEHQAEIRIIEGEALIQEGFPLIYAVGKGAAEAPRLVDIRWGHSQATRIVLVGKGVCFDSGGLDLKSATGLRQMKKDMAGAAHALALGRWIMQANWPVSLRILLPIVENAIDRNSYHPGDVIRSRSGHYVEIDNTDAEGRLILCDALTAAVEERPDYLIDFATLTGACTVALGPEISALFSNHPAFQAAILEAAEQVHDPMWPMPLYEPYRNYLKSDCADFMNASRVPAAGAITAALYLKTFVPDDIPWAHIDFHAQNLESKPGRPVGGEAMAIRAVFHALEHLMTCQ